MPDLPWLLALLLLPAAFLWWGRRRYLIRHAYVRPLPARPAGRWQRGLFWAGWGLVAVAAADWTWGVTVHKQVVPVRRYVLINDASGSMLGSSREPRGVGPALAAVEAGNEAFLTLLGRRADGSRDLVGAVVFDQEAYVVSYLVDDPAFVMRCIRRIRYNEPPLGGGTQLDVAMWAGIDMVLDSPTGRDYDLLRRRMYGEGAKYNKAGLEVDGFRRLAAGASLVVFTDGEFSSPAGGPNQMSSFKLLDLCKDVGIRVYVISVDVVEPNIARLTRATGGDTFRVAGLAPGKVKKAYEDIIASQAADRRTVDETVRRSLTPYIAGPGLVMLLLAVLLRMGRNRAYTEI